MYRVLCVDDEPRVLSGLELHLGLVYEVASAPSGAEALAMIEASSAPFAVVISDMRMPKMNGARLLQKVRALSPDTTRILLTGHTEVESAIAAINDGQIFRFLTKPCAPQAMLDAVAAGCEQFKLRCSERELLEGTVRGTVKVLTDVLAIVSPQAFQQTTNVRGIVMRSAPHLGLEPSWDLEVASLLARLGAITLTDDLLRRVLDGGRLSDDEKTQIDGIFQAGARLLDPIPRLNSVVKILSAAGHPRSDLAIPPRTDADRTALMGALVAAAVLADQTQRRGLGASQLKTELMHAGVQSELVDALDVTARETPNRVTGKLTVRELRPKQVLMEPIRTKTGVVLVPEGTELNAVHIARLESFASRIGIVEPINVRL